MIIRELEAECRVPSAPRDLGGFASRLREPRAVGAARRGPARGGAAVSPCHSARGRRILSTFVPPRSVRDSTGNIMETTPHFFPPHFSHGSRQARALHFGDAAISEPETSLITDQQPLGAVHELRDRFKATFRRHPLSRVHTRFPLSISQTFPDFQTKNLTFSLTFVQRYSRSCIMKCGKKA